MSDLTIGKITYSPDYGKSMDRHCDHKHAKRIGKSELIWCRDCQRTVREVGKENGRQVNSKTASIY